MALTDINGGRRGFIRTYLKNGLNHDGLSFRAGQGGTRGVMAKTISR
jgi:hypothetical protein